MASFSVANTLALRNFYNSNRTLAVKSNRNDASTNKLNYADSMALRRVVKQLDTYDFDNAKKTDLEEKVRAWVDTYNYTMDSCKSSTNTSVASAYKGLKNLTKEYADELENLGIKADSSGYLKMSSSATKNISGSRFKELLGKDSEFMKKVGTYAKRIANHVDLYA